LADICVGMPDVARTEVFVKWVSAQAARDRSPQSILEKSKEFVESRGLAEAMLKTWLSAAGLSVVAANRLAWTTFSMKLKSRLVSRHLNFNRMALE